MKFLRLLRRRSLGLARRISFKGRIKVSHLPQGPEIFTGEGIKVGGWIYQRKG